MNLGTLDRAERLLTAVALALTTTMLVGITATVLVAVVCRYLLNVAIVYSFDLTTLLFCWMIFAGLIVGERDGSHLNLDFLHFILSERAERWVVVLRQLVATALCLFIAWVGVRLTLRTGLEIPSMRISQKWLYAALPFGFALFSIVYMLRTAAAVVSALSTGDE